MSSYNYNDILKPYLEKDKNENPYPHMVISDIKYAAQWYDPKQEQLIKKLFDRIKAEPPLSERRSQLVKLYLEILERKYNDQTIPDKNLKPEKVGRVVDRVLNRGLRRIALWATGLNFNIFDYLAAGTGTGDALFGDTALEHEIKRINVTTGVGFLDPSENGWAISAGFPRGTATGIISEMGATDTETAATGQFFDRSVFPLNDRTNHVLNQDSFTLTGVYILTSV